MKLALGVETSCDDTSCAVVREDGFVLFNRVVCQHPVHQAYGGVVPELASRNHTYHLLPLVEQALKESGTKQGLKDMDVFSVTTRPGLTGSLLVGLVTVKTLSLALNKPYVGINHLEGHILSPLLWNAQGGPPTPLSFPCLALIVSGAHTHLFKMHDFGHYTLVGQTVDDGAGEAFDKVAKMLGLCWPGGPEVDQQAQKANPDRSHCFFPQKVTFKKPGAVRFSFSGLKAAAVRILAKLSPDEKNRLIPTLCRDFQEAVVRQLMSGLGQAVQLYPEIKEVVIAGGVSANSLLRSQARAWAKKKGLRLLLPLPVYCTDNAAMIALAGLKRFAKGERSPQSLNVEPSSLPEDFKISF